MTCVEKRGIFFLGGVGVCSLGGEGRVGRGRRRRNWGGEGRQNDDILTFAEGITDGLILSVIPVAILTENWSCHCTETRV